MHSEMTDRPNSIRWALILVVLTASIARVSTLNEPFTRNHESTACGPMVCAARNMVRYGFFTCHFGYVLNCDRVDPTQFTYYNHHPPLVPIMLALSAKICGDQPWSYRLPGAICSVLASALLFLMLTRKFDWRVGLATAMLYALCPFNWLFGDMPDVVGPQLMLFGLLAIECYFRWSDAGVRSWLYWAIAAWFLAALTDWPAFFLIPILSAHYLFMHPMRTWWRVLPPCFFSLLFLGALLGWLMIGGDKSVITQFVHRMHGPSDAGKSIGFFDWLSYGIGYYVRATFTLPVMILFLAYIASLVWIGRNGFHGFSANDTTLIMLAWGFVQELIWMQSSYQHMWVWCVLLPGACAAAVLGGRAIWQILPSNIRLSPFTPYVAAGLAFIFVIDCYLKANFLNNLGLPTEPVSYTLEDFGNVIRDSVPAGQGVLTSDVGDPITGQSESALWYYSDRQLRNGIRTPEQLDNSLSDGDYQLFEGFIQHGGPAPWWFIMPCEHHEKFKELANVLDARYARWQERGFLIYYLRWTPADAAKAEATSR